jgi:hypothetical protein
MAYGIFGMPQGLAESFAKPMQQPQERPKGDGTRRAIGILGDFLLGLGGQQGVYGPQAHQKKLLEQRAQQEAMQSQMKRETDWQDWQRQYEYERKNPKPGNSQPYRFEGNDGDVYELGPDGQPRRIFDDPTPKMNFIPDGMGGGRWEPMPGAAVPAAPVGKLTPIGGPAQSAPGGFPR